jgi:prepilin-type N-terminal cleavage/methylation domain-containing protein
MQRSTVKQRKLPHGKRPTNGFTLIELLIALVLLDVGLLALVGVSAALSREALRTRNASLASSIATAGVERAASLECRGPREQRLTPNAGITAWFSESPGAHETRTISESVAVVTPRGVQTAAIRTGARC